jgi:hypothetical protein
MPSAGSELPFTAVQEGRCPQHAKHTAGLFQPCRCRAALTAPAEKRSEFQSEAGLEEWHAQPAGVLDAGLECRACGGWVAPSRLQTTTNSTSGSQTGSELSLGGPGLEGDEHGLGLVEATETDERLRVEISPGHHARLVCSVALAYLQEWLHGGEDA